MKVLIRQFLGKNHSWCVCGHGIARSLLKLGHQVDLFSTDGLKHFPEDLKSNLIGYTEENQTHVYGAFPIQGYDAQISYTSMKNFPLYLSHGDKNRIGIWCYEWSGPNVIPTGFAKHYKSCDYLVPPSQFAKRVFLESKIPEKSIKVIPHGIYSSKYTNTKPANFKTNKTYKILANIAQNHTRKNIPGLLDAYGKAFTNKDDVCLILKASNAPITMPFHISLTQCINNFNNNYKNHAEIKIFNEFVDDIESLYLAADTFFTMSHAEGFLFPALESLAAGKMNIVPNYGGQLDFCNNSNSLLIEGKEVRADPKSMYWESKTNAIWFMPSISDAVDKLRYAYNHYQSINERVKQQSENILIEYDWTNIVNKMLAICI